MLPVTAASVVAVVAVVGCKNREQNGQEIRFTSLDAAAIAGAIAGADAGSDAVRVCFLASIKMWRIHARLCVQSLAVHPVHPPHLYPAYLMFSGAKTANKTDKKFDSQVWMQLRMHFRMQLECVFWPQSRCGESTLDYASKVWWCFPCRGVTGASAVGAVDAVQSKNREQNGKGVQNANRETLGETPGCDSGETRETS